MHAVLTVSLRTVAPPRRGEHVLGEGALGTERGRRPARMSLAGYSATVVKP